MILSKQSEVALKTLGLFVKVARESAHMSQNALATRLGVTRQTVAAIEQGSGKVAIATVFEAAYLVDVPLMSADRENIPRWQNILHDFDALLPAKISNKRIEMDDNF
jgi:DNA-binding XRE family transcriptional regulator